MKSADVFQGMGDVATYRDQNFRIFYASPELFGTL